MSNFTEMYQEPDRKQVSGNYSLSGTLCTPKNNAKDTSYIQYLIHGVGFDSRYAYLYDV